MPRKCGCGEGSGRCTCQTADTPSVTWQGDGAEESPSTPALTFPLEVQDTPSLNTDLTEVPGVGSETAFRLSASLTGSPMVWIYTANDTWNDPGGLTALRIILVGGGGGGGGFTLATFVGSDDWVYGGFGGGGAAVTDLLLDVIPASAPVVTGIGGAGGNGAADGFDGTETSFGPYLASGGLGGPQGYVNDDGPGGFPADGNDYAGKIGTAPGGGSVVVGNVPVESTFDRLAPGGGGQAVVMSQNAATLQAAFYGGYSPAGAGQRILGPASGYRSTPESLDGVNGLTYPVGTGGHGGDFEEDGGDGGLYGAGGGGGAPIPFPSTTRGGDGAPGICIVMGW